MLLIERRHILWLSLPY